MSKFERKFSKYAIRNLSLILIICYAIGYLIQMIDKNGIIFEYISLDPYAIIHGQVWRLITWVLIPPSGFDFWVIITLFFYYSIGRTLESTWGDYLYNVYIFSGLLFTILGAFTIMGFLYLFPNDVSKFYGMELLMNLVGRTCFSTYYVNMSIFLAFAATFPEQQVLLMFFIPVKIKYLGILYAILLAYEVIRGTGYERVAIVASLLNFIVFFLLSRKKLKGSPISRMKAAKRRYEFTAEVNRASTEISKHKCAICGRTELDSPNLSFRFCSKCNGNYEYCEEHLFTHTHVE